MSVAHIVSLPTERKKAAGKLRPFDPTAHYVHPKSRVRMVVNINKSRATVNISSGRSVPRKRSVEVVPDSEDEADSDGDDEVEGATDDEYDEDASSVPPPRRKTRANPVKKLPFSPKKTRSTRVFPAEAEDSDEQDERSSHAPARRSTRVRKGFKVSLDADAYLDGSEPEADDSDEYESTAISKSKRAKPKKIIRGRAARPAYGHFRVVADLDYDSHSDEESLPLRAHRDICEKCHRGPAHELLSALSRKPKGKGRRRKKQSEEESDDSGDEKEKLAALGGWVRWSVLSLDLLYMRD